MHLSLRLLHVNCKDHHRYQLKYFFGPWWSHSVVFFLSMSSNLLVSSKLDQYKEIVELYHTAGRFLWVFYSVIWHTMRLKPVLNTVKPILHVVFLFGGASASTCRQHQVVFTSMNWLFGVRRRYKATQKSSPEAIDTIKTSIVPSNLYLLKLAMYWIH